MFRSGAPAPLRFLAWLVVAPLCAAVSEAQVSEVTSELFPETVAALEARIDAGDIRGVVAVVEVGGERICDLVLGDRDFEEESPMTSDAIFRIYSMSKPITAVGALILFEEGRFELDDPVENYLPDFEGLEVGVSTRDARTGRMRLHRVPTVRVMTIRDLLRHTSGLTYGLFAQSPVDSLVSAAGLLDGKLDLEGVVRTLGTLPLKHQPGTTFEYSLSTDVLGRLIEVLAEDALDHFFEERIFRPLGMNDTGFRVAEEKLGRLAKLYERGSDGLAVSESGAQRPQDRPIFLSGGGGLLSTLDDYLRFARMLLAGGTLGGERILQEETVALMTRDHLGDLVSPLLLNGYGFGLGVAVSRGDIEGGPHRGTYWWGGLAGTSFWIDPVEQLIGVYMIQNLGEQNHSAEFQRGIYGELGLW